MKIRVLQHVAHEGPAGIERWAASRGHTLEITRLDRGEPLPDVAAFDALVIMGGPMSANDEGLHPWIAPEKRLIQAAIQESRRILGVCLGSQMIASALGRRVFATPVPEIGWFPVRVRAEAARSRTFAGVMLGSTFRPFHWHGETFDLPEGALHLAETDDCPNQAFEIEFDGGPSRGGALVLALQFHMEATAASIAAMSAGQGVPIAPEPAASHDALQPLLDDVLDRLTAPWSR